MWVKYKIEKKQIYQNGGWVDTDPLQTRLGDAIGEYDSFSGCSGYDILYRWQPANPNEDWVCSGYTKYYKEYYQVSYDNGVTYVNVIPEQTRTGDFIEDYSRDCGYVFEGKWKATYSSGTTTAACDSTSSITKNEIYRTGLTSVEVGDCVTSIGTEALWYTNTLTSVTLSNSLLTIGEGAFDNCTGLTSITIPNSVITINSEAFYHCRAMVSATIGNSVTSIGQSAFYHCYSLSSVTIGNSVTNIGNNAFRDCFALTSVTIPNSVTSIGVQAFCSCSGLTSVNIPNTITRIEEGVFASCSGLTSVTIPDSVTYIGESAFQLCTSLTSVTIPSGVTTIVDWAFWGCTGLQSITCLPTTPPTLAEVGEYSAPAFNNTNNCLIRVPAASLSAYQNAWPDYVSRLVAIT